MWVCIDARFRGFSFTSIQSPLPNPVFATKGERSVMLFSARRIHFRLVKPLRDERSDMGVGIKREIRQVG